MKHPSSSRKTLQLTAADEATDEAPKAAPGAPRGLDDIVAGFKATGWRTLAWTSVLALTSAGVWASTVKLDRVATATGVVAPVGQVRVAQHAEGGVAQQILVKEGDRVAAGEPLITLDLGTIGLQPTEIQVKIDGLRLERARLIAEAQQIDLALPSDEAARQADLAAAETETYRAKRREYQSTLALLRDQKSQRELEVSSIASQLEAAKGKLGPLKEQMNVSEKLIAVGARPKVEALPLQRDLKEIESEIAALSSALPKAQAALAESREREIHERNRFRNAAAERLRVVEMELAREVERLDRAKDRAETATVVSPIDGVVKSLAINAIGGVIGPAEPIAEIVPVSEALVVEARLSPNDIGHVAVGQEAVVKITTYDYLRYGALDARLARIAADADLDQNGQPYFRIILETDASALIVDGDAYPISPGMETMVDLKLGQRTVSSYLLEPVLKLRSEAFRDR